MKIKSICVICLLAVLALIHVDQDAYAAQKIIIAVYKDTPDYAIAREVFVSSLTQETARLGMEVEFIYLIKIKNREEFIQGIKEQAKDADMIFISGTPNAMAVKEAQVKIPVLFNAVADPKAAELVQSFHSPNSNFTGVYCAVAAHTQLQMLLKVIPEVKTLGIIYNPKDPASVSQLKSWRKAASYWEGIEVLDFPIPETVDSAEKLGKVTKAMIGGVDVIVTMADSHISLYGQGVIDTAIKYKIATYASLGHMVEQGSLFSLGFNFEKATKIVNIPQAIKILQGTPPGKIPVGTYPYYDLIINLKTAQKIGVQIPNDAIKAAAKIIK